MFDLTIMYDQTESPFFLFKTTLDSINVKKPETILTNQCQKMMNAIGTIFSYSPSVISMAHQSKCSFTLREFEW